MQKQHCPIRFVQINQNKVRLIAFLVFVLSVTYLLFPHWSIAGFLAIDFFFRGFNMGGYSVLGNISNWLIKKLSIANRPVDAGAKEFAALMGFVMSDLLFILSIFDLYYMAVIIAGLLITFSFLEAAFGFCAGCRLYSYYKSFVSVPSEDTVPF